MQSFPTATLNSELACIIRFHWGYKDDGLIPNHVYFEKSSILGKIGRAVEFILGSLPVGESRGEHIISTKYHHY